LAGMQIIKCDLIYIIFDSFCARFKEDAQTVILLMLATKPSIEVGQNFITLFHRELCFCKWVEQKIHYSLPTSQPTEEKPNLSHMMVIKLDVLEVKFWIKHYFL